MLHIKWENGDHKIDWLITRKQEELMRNYRRPLQRKLAEEQAAKYRRDPDKYRVLGYVTDLLDQDIYAPYLGAVGGDTYIFHKIDDEYAIQYQYLDAKPIWLTAELGIKADGVYTVIPTGLGYIVKYQVDITDYDKW